MDARTRTALLGSIEKWQKIVDGTGEDKGSDNCPLCQEFRYRYRCHGCPVFSQTGQIGCRGTPYDDYESAEDNHDTDGRRAVAKAELAFLKCLLPEG